MNISLNLKEEGLQFKRFLGEELILPHTDFDTIRIQPNDTVSSILINSKLRKLYENFMYLYQNTRVASNLIPVSSMAVGGVSATPSLGNKFSWWYGASASEFLSLSSVGIWGENSIQEIAGIKNKEEPQYSFFTTTGRDIVGYKSTDDQSALSQVLSTNEMYPGSNVFWQDITDIEFDTFNQVFVLDKKLNKLVCYDASGFTTNDNVIQDLLVYKDSIGSYGTFDNPTQFNAPEALTINQNHIFVLDSGNSCVKEYDENLNWVITYRLFRDFLSAYPVDITNDISGNFYILGNNGYVLKYDRKFYTKEIIDMRELSATNIEFKSIKMSPTDSNVAYIVTNQGIFKTLLTSFTNIIGSYLFYRNKIDTNDAILSFTALSGEGGDKTIVCSNSNNRTIFQLYYDNINLYDVLANPDFDIYTFEQIMVHYQEYVQNWVFNKALAKLLINHMRLRDSIVGKFLAKTDNEGTVSFRGTRYLLPEERDSILFQQDVSYFIGANEIFMNSVVNRTFKKLFDIQKALLTILQTESLNLTEENVPIFL